MNMLKIRRRRGKFQCRLTIKTAGRQYTTTFHSFYFHLVERARTLNIEIEEELRRSFHSLLDCINAVQC